MKAVFHSDVNTKVKVCLDHHFDDDDAVFSAGRHHTSDVLAENAAYLECVAADLSSLQRRLGKLRDCKETDKKEAARAKKEIVLAHHAQMVCRALIRHLESDDAFCRRVLSLKHAPKMDRDKVTGIFRDEVCNGDIEWVYMHAVLSARCRRHPDVWGGRLALDDDRDIRELLGMYNLKGASL